MQLDLRRRAEALLIPGALGLAVLGSAGLALGWAGGLRPSAVLVLIAAPLALVLRRPTAVWPGRAPGSGDAWLRGGLLALVAVYAAANLLRALHPPTGFDALNYHLPALERYLADGRLGFPTDLRFAAGPALVPAVSVLAAALGGDLAVQLVSFGMGLLATAGVHAVAGRAFGPTPAALAAALFYTTPIVGWLSAEAYVDMGMTLFLVAALHGVLVHLDGGGRAWAWAAGLLAGAALATRYLAAVPVGLLLLDLASAPSTERGGRRRAAAVLLFAAGVALVALPWYVRNVVESGNPVYPFAGEVLGGESWSEEDRREHADYLQGVGPGRGPLDLLLVPFRLTFQPGLFGASRGTGIGYAYLLLLPLLLLARRFPRAVVHLTAYGGGGLLVWFYTSQQTRFLMPWLPALALVGGWAGHRLLRGRVHLARPAAVGLAALSILALAAGGTRWPSGAPPLGSEARERYLRRHLPGYAGAQHANRLLPPGAVLFAFGREGLRYYYDCRAVGDWFGPAAYHRFLPGDDDRALRSRFGRLGVTHLLVPDDFPDPALREFRQRPFWWDRLEPLGVSGGVRLYRLLPEPSRAAEVDAGAPPLTADPAET